MLFGNDKTEITKNSDIVKSALEEEIKKSGYNIEVLPLTVAKFLKSEYNVSRANKRKYTKRNLKTKKMNQGGLFDPNSEVVIVFIDNLMERRIQTEKGVLEKNSIAEILRVSFHELKHAFQFENKDEFSFENFIRYIENKIAVFMPEYYIEKHDTFYVEMTANLYGVSKTIDFLKSNNNEVYQNTKIYLENLKQHYSELLRFYLLGVNNYEVFYTKILMMLENGYKEVLETIIKQSVILKTFLNYDGSYKKISEIIHNPNFKQIDEKIIYQICISNSFLSSIGKNDFLDLNEEEKQFISLILSTSEKYQKLNKEKDEEDAYNESIYQMISDFKANIIKKHI